MNLFVMFIIFCTISFLLGLFVSSSGKMNEIYDLSLENCRLNQDIKIRDNEISTLQNLLSKERNANELDKTI